MINPSEKTLTTVLLNGPSYVRMVKRLKDQVCEDPRAANVILALTGGPILPGVYIGKKEIYANGLN